MRQGEVEQVAQRVVDVDRAGLQASGQLYPAVAVTGPDGGGQAVFGVVG
jgi:hypothetical protein